MQRLKLKIGNIALVLGVAAILVTAIFLLWPAYVPEHSIYVSADNLNQGGTALVKVSRKYKQIKGEFNNKKLDFFKAEKNSDWSAILGVDVDLKPGQYDILVTAPNETIFKKITVLAGKFASGKMYANQEMKKRGLTEQKAVEEMVKNDGPALSQAIKNFSPDAYFGKAFSFPLKNMRVSGFNFGQFVDNGGIALRHFGVDLAASVGTSVYAVNSGKIVLEKNMADYGKTIVIDHGLGIYSIYLHLSEFKVKIGQNVKEGQMIALSGNTGYVTGPHLHFSVRSNGSRVDPVSFVKSTKNLSEQNNLASLRDAFLNLFK